MNNKAPSILSDVFPLFNFTNNEFSESRLLHILSSPPLQVSGIQERQLIIEGFKANWDVLGSFGYQKIAFLEVHTFLDKILNRKIVIESNSLKASFLLTVNHEKRQQVESQLIQAILFFDNLNQRYFLRAKTEFFPDSFTVKLKQLHTFISGLNTEQNAKKIRDSRFSLPCIVALLNTLSALKPYEVNLFWQDFFEFEAFCSITRGVLDHSFMMPQFSAGTFVLENFYHPTIKSPVKNSLNLGRQENVVLITGPNMSGKSTLLKAIGLCVYLAHVGVGVPASYCSIPFFGSIAIAINLDDNVQDGYSHFMAEIKNLKHVLQDVNNSETCFAIFDELFKGTNFDDAVDISLTTIKGLTNFKDSFFFISTHLLSLDQLTECPGIKKYNIDCQLDNGIPEFTYKLKEGWSDLRIGKILFEREGLSQLLGIIP